MQLFERIQHADEVINRIQDRLKAVINAIVRKPIVDGQLITFSIGAHVQAPIAHKLGRVPQGWILVNGIADTITETATRDERFLYLTTGSVAITGATIWVF